MDLTLNEDQQAFVSASIDWCRGNMPLEKSRERPQGLWQQIEEMGWTGIAASEDDGGLGLDFATEAVVFSELGQFLPPIALISTAVANRWFGASTSGKIALSLADDNDQTPAPESRRILDPVGASATLEQNNAGMNLLEPSEGTAPIASFDLATEMSVTEQPGKIVQACDDPRSALHFQLLAAALAVGTADAARDMAAEYALTREQFGRPIGWFQSLKHICSDMAVRSAVARSQLYYAACALDENSDDAAFQIASAKQLADQAALDSSRANIQVHGGIGMTDEAYPHLCLKRAHLLGFIAPAKQNILLGENE